MSQAYMKSMNDNYTEQNNMSWVVTKIQNMGN